MYPHHERTIQKVTDHFRDDPRFLALIIGGSVAKGWAAENSDVDIMLVATDEEFARRLAANEFLYYTTDFCDYPDGYVDGKIINIALLEDIAARGSEPAKAAFYCTWAAFSRDPRINDLIERIPVYPEAEREAKIKSFYSQVIASTWFVKEATKRGDKYLLTHGAHELALFSSRLVLAHNRILYPYHKWLMHEIARAPEKPEGFETLLQALLEQPSPATADAVCEAVTAFANMDMSVGEAFVNFTKDSEWNWRELRTPIHDR